MDMDFKSFTDDIERNGWNVFGTEVYKDGVLAGSFGDTAGLHEMYSATKTVLSVAIGIARDEGLIDLDRSILDYIPEEYSSDLPSDRTEAWRKITIKRLLTMSVPSLPFRHEGENWLKYALSCDIGDGEKREFNYSNVSAYLAGVALTHAVGTDAGKFIEDRIFRPLDISEYEYGRSPEGYFYGASQMKLSVHDLSRIGLLLYNGGTYEGRQIVSRSYVDEASSVQQMNREGGYGYFIWKYRDGFSINGKWKQKCYVLPSRGIVVTYLSDIRDDSHDLLKSMEKNILGINE